MTAFLVAIVLMLIVALGVAGWLAVGLFMRDARRRERYEQSADQVMGELFNGDRTVVYKAPDSSGGLSLETLVHGANEHGYRLVSETGHMATRRVAFERL